MAAIEEYKVLEPPTSGEVEAQSLEVQLVDRRDPAYRIMQLTILAEQDVPRPVPRKVTFRIIQSLYAEEGGEADGMVITGRGVVKDPEVDEYIDTDDSYVVRTDKKDRRVPAHLSIVSS